MPSQLPTPLTVEQVQARVKCMLDEHCDGALVLGFTVDGTGFIISSTKDSKTALAINALLSNVLANGGVHVRQRDESE